MPVRVELVDEAVEDLIRYARTGNLPQFLKKLLRLESVGADAGTPLGKNLSGWRRIVVGDRDWRILFSVDAAASTATVWVIGNRRDSECYDEARRRVTALGTAEPHAASLAAALVTLSEMQRRTRRRS